MKPNSPTHGQPNPRKNRLKVAFGPLFPAANIFLWVGIDFIPGTGSRLQETQPNQILHKYLHEHLAYYFVFPIYTRYACVPFFCSIRFWLFNQWWTFYARKAARFSEWVHLSERYSMQKSACPINRSSSNYCRLAKIWSKKSEVAPNPKNRPIFERGTASDCFSSDYAPWAKTWTTPVEERIFEVGTSRSDGGLVPRTVWLISSVYRSKTNMNAKKKSTSNRITSCPHRKRKTANDWNFPIIFCAVNRPVPGTR